MRGTLGAVYEISDIASRALPLWWYCPKTQLKRLTGMIGDLQEKSISCPYCGELIGLLIDTSVSPQAYIEDCSVCCRPIEVHVVVEDDQCFVEARADSD
jgi:hypothetical protein